MGDQVQTSGGVVVEFSVWVEGARLTRRDAAPAMPARGAYILLPGFTFARKVETARFCRRGNGWITQAFMGETRRDVADDLRAAGWGDPSDEPTFIPTDNLRDTRTIDQCMATHPATGGICRLPKGHTRDHITVVGWVDG